MTVQRDTPRRGRKPGLTREQIIDAALALADQEGLAAFSLRKLAAELGVTPMALYSYFQDKDALLDAMVGQALGTLTPGPQADSPFPARLEQTLLELKDVLVAHPAIAQLLTQHYVDDRQLDQFRDRMLVLVGEAGLDRTQTANVLRVMTSYVLGFAIVTETRQAGTDPLLRADNPAAFQLGVRMLLTSLTDPELFPARERTER